MSKCVTERLWLKDIKPSNISLIFGDVSADTPRGIIRDLQLVVGNCIIPTDFHVLDTNKIDWPLILGRAFFATVGSMIDHCNHRVTFAKINQNKIPIRRNSCIVYVPKTKVGNKKKVQKDHGGNKTSKLQQKLFSRPFSKFKIIIPPELHDSTEKKIRDMVKLTNKVLLGAKVLRNEKRDKPMNHVLNPGPTGPTTKDATWNKIFLANTSHA